jgi:GT2 family glycosyltransferase
MKVAIVILNWNGLELLRTFLPRVVEYSREDGVDIYVADNASNDQSIAYVQKEFPSVKTVILDKNYGFAGGYNRALKQIEAHYYLLLNSDVAPGKNWIPPLIRIMDENPDVAACMPAIKDFNQPQQYEYAGAAGGFIDHYGYPFCRGRLMDVLEEDKGQYNKAIPVFWASGAALMVRSELFHSNDGLDEDFFAHMEEIDFCWRLKNQGWIIMAEPASEVYHVGGGTLHQQHARKTYLNFRNNLFMLVKNLPAKRLLPTLFIRMVLDGIAAFHFISKGEWRFFTAVLKAHFSFYRQLPAFLRKRRELALKVTHINHPEMYTGSLVWQYFIRGKKFFSSLFPMDKNHKTGSNFSN